MKEKDVIFKKIDDLIREKLKNQPFQFEAPKEMSWNIIDDELPKSVLKWIENYEYLCHKVLKLAKMFHLRKLSVADTAQTIFDMLPLPLPETQIHRKNDIIRYRTTILRHKKGILLSLKLINLSEDLGDIAGVNQSKLETALIATVRGMMNRSVQGRVFVLDRRIDVVKNIKSNTWESGSVSEAELAEAIDRIPDVILFAIIHAVLAVAMPLLKPNRKPFYLPAIRLSQDLEIAQEQLQILRSVLGGFDFACAPGNRYPCTLELTLQDINSIDTLAKVEGSPILVRVTKPKIQAKLAEMLQQAHCSLNAAGISEHPFQTVPLLVGNHLLPDNVALTLEWKMPEYAVIEDLYILQRHIKSLLGCLELFSEEINTGLKYLPLYGRSYPETYFLHIENTLGFMLFDEEEHAEAFTKRATVFLNNIREQEIEKVKNFQNAIKLLKNLDGYRDVIADCVSEMNHKHFGFFYIKKDRRQYILFDPKDGFPKFCENKLGLSPAEAGAFCDYLHMQKIIQKRTEPARDKSGNMQRFIFIPLNFVCHEGQNDCNS